MNLKDAKKRGKLTQFAKEHEIKDPHPMGKERFDALLDAMSHGRVGKPADQGTQRGGASGGSAGKKTRRGT